MKNVHVTVGEARVGASADVAVWRILVASDPQLEESPPQTTSLPCLLSDDCRTKARTCAEQALEVKFSGGRESLQWGVERTAFDPPTLAPA